MRQIKVFTRKIRLGISHHGLFLVGCPWCTHCDTVLLVTCFLIQVFTFRKKGSKSSGIINEVNFRATPTDEEVQFGFKKTAINSENQPPSSSSAKKQLNFSAVSKTEKSPNHLKKSPEKNKKVDTSLRNVKKSDNHEKSCNVKNFSSVKKNSSKTPRQPSSERFPSLSFSSTSSSNTQSSHELVRYHKNQSRQHYVNGGLSSIDEELSRKTTRPKNEYAFYLLAF